MQDIAKAARTGPATTVLEGISSGLESAVWALVAIAVAIGAALVLGGGNIALLALPGGPHRHRHAGHHRHRRGRGHLRPGGRQRRGHRRDGRRVRGRARADHGEPRRGGQHHQGRHQGLRHRLGRHRRRGPVRLLRARRSPRARSAPAGARGRAHGTLASLVQINVADPKTFIGLLIGGSVAFMFSLARHPRRRPAPPAPWCRRCAASSGRSPGSWTTPSSPTTAPVIDICTTRLAARAGHPGPARRAHAGHHRLRPRLPTPSAPSWPRPSSPAS